MSIPRIAVIGVVLAAGTVGGFLLLRSKRASGPPGARSPIQNPAASLDILRPLSADRALAVRTGADRRPVLERIDSRGNAEWTADLPPSADAIDWIGVPDASAPGGELILVRYHGAEATHAHAQGLAAYARAGGELRWTAELPAFERVGGYAARAPIDLPFRPLDDATAPGVILATVDDGLQRWVMGIAPSDGAIKWKQPLAEAPHTTPVGRWLVLDTREGMVFVDTGTGEASRVEGVRSGCELGGNYLAVMAGEDGGVPTLVELAGGDPTRRRTVTTRPGSLFDGAAGADLVGCGRRGAERVLFVDDGAGGTRVVVLDDQDAIVRTVALDRTTCDFELAPAAHGRLAIEGELPRFVPCTIDPNQAPVDLLGDKPAADDDDDDEVVPRLAMIDLELGTIAWKSTPTEPGLLMRDGSRWYHVATVREGRTVMVFDGSTGRLTAAAAIEEAARVDPRPEIIAGGGLWFHAPGDAGRPARITVLDAATLAPRADGGIAVRDATAELRTDLNLSP